MPEIAGHTQPGVERADRAGEGNRLPPRGRADRHQHAIRIWGDARCIITEGSEHAARGRGQRKRHLTAYAGGRDHVLRKDQRSAGCTLRMVE